MSPAEPITLNRDCVAIEIPSGIPQKLARRFDR